MPHMKVNDINMYYEVHGEGEPIVLIAGFSADHLVWAAALEYFKEDYQVILLDNRGAGQTDIPDGPYSIDQMADDVAALCVGLGISKAHFVGNSMGGYIVQTLAHRHKSLIKSLVISNSASGLGTPFRIYIEAQREMRRVNVSKEILFKAGCSWLFSYHFLAQPGMLDILIQLGLQNPYPFSDKGYDGQYAALQKFNSSSWLKDFGVPTLILSADQDLIFREPLVKAFAEHINGAQYYCFKECGHLPMIEYPELFKQLVHEFIGQRKGG